YLFWLELKLEAQSGPQLWSHFSVRRPGRNDNRPKGNGVHKGNGPRTYRDKIAGADAPNAQGDGEAKSCKNLPPTALSRGTVMAQQGDGKEGKQQTIKRRCKTLVEFGSNLGVTSGNILVCHVGVDKFAGVFLPRANILAVRIILPEFRKI